MTQETKTASSRARQYSLGLIKSSQNPATQVSLSIVLSVFILAFFVLVALRPTFVTIAKLNTEIEQSTKTLDQLTKKATSLAQASRVWEQIQASLPYVEVSIPQNSPSYQALTKSIEVLVQETGVELSSLSVGKALLYSQIAGIYKGREQSVVEMDLSIGVAGEFAQTMEFLQQLLKMDRLIGITSITIGQEKSSIEGAKIGITIAGVTQYLADSIQLTKIIDGGGK